MRALIGLVMVLCLLSTVAALPITIDKVEVDDVELSLSGTNRLDVQRDGTIDVEVLLTADQDVEDVDEDDYRLRLLVTDRNGQEIFQNYQLKIDVPRHEVKVEDILLTPSGEAMAGQALLATVRLENQGEKDEDDVRVDVSIPELRVSGSDYIDEIETGDEEETEEIFMRLPLCAETGVYTVDVDVTYDEGHRSTRASGKVQVRENPQCAALAAPADDEVKVIVDANAQPLETTQPVVEKSAKSTVRKALETLVIILVGLLVIVALVIAFNKLKNDDDEEDY